ncbi:alpha/beta hydrolase [Leucobacter soli]|uniref:N-octanoylanthranilate hydrolase AqdA1 n=1 Tax=Leucobacter soli TaxID=2812850 RepID=A0A916NH44_9MICO|nr:alpha/beta hydrolase [Leucobacter soli]CAG7611966.1 putative N-octanoylanthranilate hydrolase AqdA1 [Leucobacter soli]
MALYRDFTSQEQIDEQYRIDVIETDFLESITRHADRGAATRDALPHRLGLRYGPTRDENLDFFPAARPGAPLFVFIHGGYWHAPNSSLDFSLVAAAPASAGIATAVVNYSLAPKVTIDEITRQNRAAIAWLVSNADELGIDASRIVVAGHSAGGQQVAQLMLTDWEGDYGLPADTIHAGVAISGLFDLEPFPYSWLAPRLLFTHETVVRESPLRHVRPVPGTLLLTYGAQETAEFARQTAEFFDAWQAAGNRGEVFQVEGAAHMRAFEGYGDPASDLWRRTAELFG